MFHTHNILRILKPSTIRILTLLFSSFTEVDVNRLTRSRALEYVDLSDNPIPPRTYDELKKLSRPSVSVSEREKEDWEDFDL